MPGIDTTQQYNQFGAMPPQAPSGPAGPAGPAGPGAACPPGMVTSCKPAPDPIDACYANCSNMAKCKDAECKRMNKEFMAQMKARGCNTTICNTPSRVKVCKPKVVKKRKKATKKKRKKSCAPCVWVKKC